jgi:hypothetical protein
MSARRVVAVAAIICDARDEQQLIKGRAAVTPSPVPRASGPRQANYGAS